MNVNVLLINPPLFKKDSNVWKHIDSCTPPFGLMILASILIENKINVQILDCNALRIPVEQITESIPEGEYNFIGITATTALVTNAVEIAGKCRHLFPQARIVFGGVHPTIFPEEILNNDNIDFVIRGEGEHSFVKLLAGEIFERIPGLSYKVNRTIYHNEREKKLVDIDDTPMPAYHLLPMEKYHTALGSSLRTPNIGMITSRGCPGKCTFCYGNILGSRIRFRSPEKIFSEIQYLQEKYGIREVAFYDDTFTTSKRNVHELCRLFVENKIDLTWSCFSRVDTVNLDTLQRMKKAGCHQISVGIESGDEVILKNIKKNINLEIAQEMVRNCKQTGIMVRACFMFGNPGETVDTLRTTINFAKELDPDIVLFNITTPFPGSKMFKWAKEKNYLTTFDWQHYDLSRPVMNLPTVSEEDLQKAYKLAYREFYFRFSYLAKRIVHIRSWHDVISNINAFKALVHLA